MAHTYYHLCGMPLRHWLHVEIEDDNEVKRVTFVSNRHVGNKFPVSWTYSQTFSDQEILSDEKLAELCKQKFGPDYYVGSIRI